jgi:hypothetical protein
MQNFRRQTLGFSIVTVAAFLLLASVAVSAQKKMQIAATAMGTSTQMGRIINVDVHLEKYSTAEDQKALLEAFTEDGSKGLTNAVEKMSSKGRIAITGTLGYDLKYIRLFNMPDGGTKIRFVTDRPITFGEHWGSTRSMDYTLSMGEIILSKAKGKSTGTLMPAAKLRLNKEREIEIETYQNPWNLVNIKVW